jgi:hypothetical protein
MIYYHTVSGPYIMWCYCCYHVISLFIRHIFITDWKKFRTTKFGLSSVVLRSYHIS